MSSARSQCRCIQAGHGGDARTVAYDYDEAGRRTLITYPGGVDSVLYEYDDANRLVSVTDWDLNETVYAYDDANRMTSVTLPNGIVTSYGYDDAARLLTIDHDLGLTPIASVAYALDAVGNRTQRVDDLGTHTYTYDDLHRLTEVTYPGPTTTPYDLDAFGNRESMTDASGTTTYAYDDAERLTTVTPPSPASPISYTWDDNGNLTARGGDSFTWDYEDRMVEAEVDSVTTTFEYRGDGLRNSATVGMNTTTYTWDIAAGLPVILQENDTRYIWGAHGLIAQVDEPDWLYYHADGLGSTLAITDDVGAVEQTYEYDVYGAVTGGTGSLGNSYQFAGEQVDASTGLQYLRMRYLDISSGVFISRDPLAGSPSWSGHPFAYAQGNPVVLSDPSGLDPIDWIFGRASDVLGLDANGAELSWCANPLANLFGAGDRAFKCMIASRLSEYAVNTDTALYPGGAQDDSPRNAFRHCFWSGLMTLKWDIATSKGFGDRHEKRDDADWSDPFQVAQRSMDLHNNGVGRQMAHEIKNHARIRRQSRYSKMAASVRRVMVR